MPFGVFGKKKAKMEFEEWNRKNEAWKKEEARRAFKSIKLDASFLLMCEEGMDHDDLVTTLESIMGECEKMEMLLKES